MAASYAHRNVNHFRDGLSTTVNVVVNPGTLVGNQWVKRLPDGNMITFVLTDKAHDKFRRDGSDLIYSHRQPVRKDDIVSIELFTGELVELMFEQPPTPGFKKRIDGYGFPLPTQPWKRGDLVVELNAKRSSQRLRGKK